MDAPLTEVAAMHTRPTLIVAALAAASGIAINCAHAPPPELPAPRASGSRQVEAGQRVRVTAFRWNWSKHIGKVTALSADTITLLVTGADQPLALPLDAVHDLEVSRGHRHRGALAGAGRGALTGAIVGGALSAYGFLVCSGYTCVSAAAWAPLGALIGAVYGGIHGASSYPEVWERVPLDLLRRLRIGIDLQPGGRLGLGAAIRF
jgi:hypothetical protein